MSMTIIPEPARPKTEVAVFRALEAALAYAIADEKALIAARDTWDRLAGKIHDDEPLYEERAAAFLEWYALDHEAGDQPPPVERLILERSARAPAPAMPATETPPAATSIDPDFEIASLTALAASHRSLFRVREITSDVLLLDDLWGGATFRARERRQLAGVGKGEIFDARLVADVERPPELLLTRIVCVHPREAEDAIRAHVAHAKEAGDDRDALLFMLLRLRVQCERYRHVAPLRIYTAGERARKH